MRVLHVFPESMAEGSEQYARELTEGLRDLQVKVEVLRADRASLAMRAKLWGAVGRSHVVMAGFLEEPLRSVVTRLAELRGKPVVEMGEDIAMGAPAEKVRNLYESLGARCAIPQGKK